MERLVVVDIGGIFGDLLVDFVDDLGGIGSIGDGGNGPSVPSP